MREKARKIYLGLSLLTAAGVLIFLLLRPGTEGDTQTLVRGAFHALGCMRAGQWRACPGVEPFAIYRYIPAIALAALGAGAGLIMHVLAYISWVAYLLCFYEIWRALRPRGEALAWAGFLVLASGFGMRYLNLSSGEMLSAYLILIFVSTFVAAGSPARRSLWVSALLAFAATITKETAFPFLLLWVFSVVLFVPEARRTIREGVVTSLAIFAGVAVNLAFNEFRFGSLKNLQYMQPSELVTDPRMRLDYFLVEWFSPAGGLWIFWTSFCVLMTAGLWIALKKRARGPSGSLRPSGFSRWKSAEPGLAVAAMLFGLTLGYSGWYSPLGGFCWGARFYIPWVPAMALFVLWVYARELGELFRKWARRPALFWGVLGVLAVSAFPQYAFLLRMSLIGRVLQPAACRVAHATLDCVFWQPWPWGIVSFFEPLPRLDLFCLAAFMSTWVFALGVKIRDSAIRDSAGKGIGS